MYVGVIVSGCCKPLYSPVIGPTIHPPSCLVRVLLLMASRLIHCAHWTTPCQAGTTETLKFAQFFLHQDKLHFPNHWRSPTIRELLWWPHCRPKIKTLWATLRCSTTSPLGGSVGFLISVSLTWFAFTVNGCCNLTLYKHVKLAGNMLLCHLCCCCAHLPFHSLSDRMKLNRSTLRSITCFQSNARYNNHTSTSM